MLWGIGVVVALVLITGYLVLRWSARSRSVPPIGPTTGRPTAVPPATGYGAAPPPPRAVSADTRFSVVRPVGIPVGGAGTLVVFAHRGQPYDGVDPQVEISQRVEQLFDGGPVRSSFMAASAPVAFGTRLRVEASFPGAVVDPEAAELTWRGHVHEVSFRIHAPAETTTLTGDVRVWCGPVILAETVVSIPVTGDTPLPSAAPAPAAPAVPDATVREELRRYRKIFASYAHADGAIVDEFAAAARAIGDDYLRDVVTLRSGEEWDERLLGMIEDADVFQLFWSGRSMRSEHCRREWEHALGLGRTGFVRPLYWEEPLPADPALGLPPEALSRLHFARVNRPRPAPPPPPPPTQPYAPPPMSPPPQPVRRPNLVPVVVIVVVVLVAVVLLVRW